jgi:hypothetical protein
VIWLDKTSVTWGGQRGRIRVWCTSKEAYLHCVIQQQWKGFKQFMFWGSFLYKEKGPCHMWEDETEKENKESKKWLKQVNVQLDADCKAA